MYLYIYVYIDIYILATNLWLLIRSAPDSEGQRRFRETACVGLRTVVLRLTQFMKKTGLGCLKCAKFSQQLNSLGYLL